MRSSKIFGSLFISALFVVGCGKGTTTSVDMPDKKITPVQSKSAGKFSIARMRGALDKVGATFQTATTDTLIFDLGDAKSTTSFFFLMTNSGGREITNITLSSTSPSFQVTPASIGSLPAGGSASILPIIRLTALHGMAANGLGQIALMPMGLNSGFITISGSTTDSTGAPLTVTLVANATVQAKVMDISLSDASGAIDLIKAPETAGAGPNQTFTGMAAFRSYSNLSPAWIKNIGNVTIIARFYPRDDIPSITIPTVDTIAVNDSAKVVVTGMTTSGIPILVELDGQNTVTVSSHIQLSPNGNGYFMVGPGITGGPIK